MLEPRRPAWRELAARCSILWIASLFACSSEVPLSVVLVTVDTLRADALDPYRPGDSRHGRTPRISLLAADSTLFERAFAPMPLTRPSHFSIMTGRYPREHGVMNNEIALPDDVLTLAEILRDRGYHTGAVVGVNLLGAESGAFQGFDFRAAPQSELEWRARRVVSQASAWLEGLPSNEPFFLWVHMFDPHQPYDPPAEFRESLDPELETQFPVLGWTELMRIAEHNGGRISSEVLEHGRSLYQAEVAAVDAAVGDLIDRVDALRARDRVMIVFSADHGECFENGIFFEHSNCLFEGGVRVPLLVRHPLEFGAGQRNSRLVSNLDIAPTVLRAAGVAIPDLMSVPPLQESESTDDRYVLLQNPFYQSAAIPARLRRQVVIRRVAGEPVAPFDASVQTIGVISGDWKYLRRLESEMLYASGVAQPPEINVALANRGIREALGKKLDRVLESHPLKVIAPGAINPELMQLLRALGYVE